MKNTFILICCVFCTFAFGQTNFVGVGVKLQVDSTLGYRSARVTAFVPGGAAEFSGIKIGDHLIKVDDKSAKNLKIEEVVGLIKGEEGTVAKLEFNQNGVMHTFKIKRKKIETSSFNITPSESSEFCNNMSRLINDAPFDFKYVIDSTSHKEESAGIARNVFPCKISIPNVKEVNIVRSFGTSCRITIGEYSTMGEVNTNGEKFIEQLKKCFPNCYYFSKKGTESHTIQIGIEGETIYTGAFMQIYSYQDKETSKYKLEAYIGSGIPKTYIPVKTPKPDTDFSNALLKVYNDVLNDFSKLKGEEHKSDDIFNASYWYDVNFSIPGSGKSYIDAGSLMDIRADEYRSLFFSGESKEDADATYTKLSGVIMEAFGDEFVYCYDKPEEFFSQIIPANSEKHLMYLKKNERGSETLPVAVLVLTKAENGKYLVYLTFYKATV